MPLGWKKEVRDEKAQTRNSSYKVLGQVTTLIYGDKTKQNKNPEKFVLWWGGLAVRHVREFLEVMGMFNIFMGYMGLHLSTPIKLYTYNLCISLYINCNWKQKTCKYWSLVTSLLLSLLWVDISETPFCVFQGSAVSKCLEDSGSQCGSLVGKRVPCIKKEKTRMFPVLLD